MMRCIFTACVILPHLGCGEDLPAPADLTASAGELSVAHDLSVAGDLAGTDFTVFPDLTPWRDLSYPAWMPIDPPSYCGGPDGGLSCAQTFFVRLAGCYRPGGPCSETFHNTAVVSCWQSGAEVVGFFLAQPRDPPHDVYSQDRMQCAVRSFPGNGIESWQLWDGSTMTVDTNTGDALCDDGTHGNVGAAYSACPAVQQLIVHVCANSDPAVACP